MSIAREIKSAASIFIELLILFFLLAWELLLKISNMLSLAWWARIETHDPPIIYWFGPFLTQRALKKQLYSFLKDIAEEKPRLISHRIIKGTSIEPLTFPLICITN